MDWTETFQQFMQEVLLFLPSLIVALVIFFAALLVARVAARWTRRILETKIENEEIVRLLSRLARWVVLIFGTLIALEQVNFDVTSFIAGLGIAGVTIGFALQDIARNFVAGILLLVQQPFRIGDLIEVADYTGRVQDVSMRETVIKTLDGEIVIVPNLDVFTNPILNYSRLTHLRRTVYIGLGYEEDVDRAVDLFMRAIGEIDGVAADPPPELRIEELGESALILTARFWVDQTKHNLFGVHSAVVQTIKEVAERASIDLPYPTQTLRLAGLPAMET